MKAAGQHTEQVAELAEGGRIQKTRSFEQVPMVGQVFDFDMSNEVPIPLKSQAMSREIWLRN